MDEDESLELPSSLPSSWTLMINSSLTLQNPNCKMFVVRLWITTSPYRWPIGSLPSTCMLCTPPHSTKDVYTPQGSTRDLWTVRGTPKSGPQLLFCSNDPMVFVLVTRPVKILSQRQVYCRPHGICLALFTKFTGVEFCLNIYHTIMTL
jgi:hypothetical protein